MSAAVSCPEPPIGTDQLRCWRPNVCAYGSTPEPGSSTGWNTWNAIQSRNAWTCRLVNSCCTTAVADSCRRRAQIRPRGCSCSRASSDGPYPTGVNWASLKMCLTWSYSSSSRR